MGPFGRVSAAMITPFTDEGALDTYGARKLATHLVDRGGCDALVVNGTTGESPTTSDGEKLDLLRAVVDAVGDRAHVTTGVGSAHTRHSVELAKASEQAGAHGLLVVTPYYSVPTSEGVVHHLATVADATSLPVLLYDIPSRTGAGSELSAESLRQLAEHPRIQGVKDCAHDLWKTSSVIATGNLATYAGCDEEILPLRALGAQGCVSAVANLAGRVVGALLDSFDAGDHAQARAHQQALLGLLEVMRPMPATVAVKALFEVAGLPGGPVRGPLLPAPPPVTSQLVDAFKQTSLD